MKTSINILSLLAALCVPLGMQAEVKPQVDSTSQSDTVQFPGVTRQRPTTQNIFEGLFGKSNPRNPSKRQVIQENAVLRGELDSLQYLVDSLMGRTHAEEREIAILEGNSPDFEYTTEATDSCCTSSTRIPWRRTSTLSRITTWTPSASPPMFPTRR